ncbi:MAG: hypothetical protein HOQ32_13305 [Lysobacter sp.]|nr:hypothetical protein [Lysobacter sp.]
MAQVPVHLFTAGKVDPYDPVLWTDAQGRFHLQRVDCTCDFPIELIAQHPDFGIGRYATTHDALERDGAEPIVVRLTALPKPPNHGAADQVAAPIPDANAKDSP